MKKNISTTTAMKPTISVDVTAAQPEATEDGAASVTPRYQAVVGLDVGDRQSHYCVLDLDGGVVAEGEVKTTEASLRVLFERLWCLPASACRHGQKDSNSASLPMSHADVSFA